MVDAEPRYTGTNSCQCVQRGEFNYIPVLNKIDFTLRDRGLAVECETIQPTGCTMNRMPEIGASQQARACPEVPWTPVQDRAAGRQA